MKLQYTGFSATLLGVPPRFGAPRFFPRESVWPWSHQPRIRYCRYQQQRQHRIQVLGLLVLRVFDVRQCFSVRDHPVLVEEGGEKRCYHDSWCRTCFARWIDVPRTRAVSFSVSTVCFNDKVRKRALDSVSVVSQR